MGEIHFDESAICPLANALEIKCEATTEGAAPCGTSADHLPPLVLAEDLCQRAVAGRAQHESQPFDEVEAQSLTAESERDLRLAWLCLEQAMPEYIERSDASDYFDDARIYADRVVRNSQTKFTVWQSASLLKAFLPLFRSETLGSPEAGEDLGPQFLQFARKSTARLGQAARQAPIHTQKTHPGHIVSANHTPCFYSESGRNGALKKMGGMLLALRAGLKIYPGSVRESAVISHRARTPATGYSHDYYALTASSHKIPVKIKSSSGAKQKFDASIVYIAYDSLVKEEAIARRDQILEARLVPETFNLQEFPLKTISWLIDEALGMPINELKGEILAGMSIKLLDTIDDYEDRLDGLETS